MEMISKEDLDDPNNGKYSNGSNKQSKWWNKQNCYVLEGFVSIFNSPNFGLLNF